jgi:hypothetical protein
LKQRRWAWAEAALLEGRFSARPGWRAMLAGIKGAAAWAKVVNRDRQPNKRGRVQGEQVLEQGQQGPSSTEDGAIDENEEHELRGPEVCEQRSGMAGLGSDSVDATEAAAAGIAANEKATSLRRSKRPTG